MPEKPLISVIMPCFNAEAYLQESVASVMAQSYPSVELIVIDDGSSDASRDILESQTGCYPNLKVLHQNNQGPYPARNLGLEKASGELVAFLDADDFWDKQCLEKLHAGLVAAGADLAYCGWQNVVEGAEDGRPYIPPPYEQSDIVDRFLKGCPWPIHAALVKRTVVEKVSGFSTRRFSSMDYDFWIRIITVTRNLVRVPEVLAYYRWHDQGQISSVKWKQVIDAWHVRNDFIRANPTLVSHMSSDLQKKRRDGALAEQAYNALWKRDLESAQRLFRFLLRTGYWGMADIKYIALSLVPSPLFRALVNLLDKHH